VTTVDWIALAVVAFAALGGLRTGLVASAFSLVGLVAGAYIGSRVAPHLLHRGSSSPWTPFAGLIGAVAGAALLQTVGSIAGGIVRRGLRLTPLRLLDSGGGFLLGAATGLALVWVLGAAAVLLPGQTTLRRDVQRSAIVRRLNEAVSPRSLLHFLARIDPAPSIAGPAVPSLTTGPGIARRPRVRGAEASVVRVVGTACGVGVQGSGWFATRRLVVTAAHVVAGESDTAVQFPLDRTLHKVDVVSLDDRNDIAILRVHGATATPLRFAEPTPGAAVAIIGFPEGGPLTVTPGRIGRTAVVLTRSAESRRPVARTVTAVGGRIRPGDSGAPAVDVRGIVRATMFAARVGSTGGYGVPSSIVSGDLRRALRPVSTGSCSG
jgi:S1-C subfamily serine protease